MKSIAWIGVLVLCSVLGAQTPSPQTPPTPPAPQTPPPTPQTPAPAQPPPSAPLTAAPEENIENMTSFALFNWRPSGGLALIGGTNSINPVAQTLGELGRPSQVNGAVLTVRAKGPTRVEISYFDARGSSNVIPSRDLSIYGASIAAGDLLAVDYRVRSAKLTWNYLTFPAPALDAKLRFKTLWEVQYTTIKPGIAFPISGDLPTSSSGKIILPTFGLGMEYVPSPKHFRFDARISGFAIPGHSQIWDGEGTFVGRFGSLEIFAGMKGYHFRTSPKTDIYLEETLWGPLGGVRWVFK